MGLPPYITQSDYRTVSLSPLEIAWDFARMTLVFGIRYSVFGIRYSFGRMFCWLSVCVCVCVFVCVCVCDGEL